MEYTKNISKKAAGVCYDLNLSSSSSGSDEEVTPGQETEAGWAAPADDPPVGADHEQQQPLDHIVPPPPENPQQPNLEQRAPPGFDPRVRGFSPGPKRMGS